MIQIPKPCHADWNGMSPEKSGRFCASCEKTVVDFTRMSDDEIKTYFAAYNQQKTCGRFLETQVNRPLTQQRSFVQAVYKRIRENSYRSLFQQALLFMLSSIIWLSSCGRKTTGENTLTGDTVAVNCNPDHAPELMGTVPSLQDTVSKKVRVQKDSTTAVKTDTMLRIYPPDHILIGEIADPPKTDSMP